jgi:hypothetical protein
MPVNPRNSSLHSVPVTTENTVVIVNIPMKNNFSAALPIAAILTAACASVVLTGCNKQDRTAASTAVQDAYADTKTAMSNAWDDVRSYSYEKRDDFTKSARALSSKFDSEVSQLRANYSDATASASRKIAMDELKNSEADYKAKLDALGHASAATWESAKQNVIAAWDKLQASYHKARAN